MKIFLYILSGVIVLYFLGGIITASIVGSKKKRQKFALYIFLSLSDSAKSVLLEIFKLHKMKNVDEVNKIIEKSTNTTNEIISVLSSENRPENFSSGKKFDKVTWFAYQTEFVEGGYTQLSASVLAGIYLFELGYLLDDKK